MKNKILLLAFCFGVCCSGVLYAQSVLYAPVAGNPSATQLNVTGRVGNFYWIQKSKKSSSFRKRAAQETPDKEGTFEIYDARLNRVKTIPYTISDAVLKQYFVAGAHQFDQLLFTSTPGKTRVSLNRYTPDGNPVSQNVPLLDLPGTIKGYNILLLRSQNKKGLLLLGFEPVEGTTPWMHAVLYNSNWNVLSHTVHKDSNLTQPFIQYDFTHYPLEHFDNSSVKLANNGDWLMVAPSRRNNNYVLFHFQPTSSNIVQTEIKLSQSPQVQNASLALDENTREAAAGLLLPTGSPAVKKVRIARYMLLQYRLAFDTTYRFQTLAAGKTREENLHEHYFVPVPAKGFLFLKEYGRPYRPPYPADEACIADEDKADSNATINAISPAFNKGDYTRYSHLSGNRRDYERGDLSLYYFPATRHDSSWSGIINKTQIGELNTSFLSYACMPLESRIVFLYNNMAYNNTRWSSTTILDEKGTSLNEGVVFWKPHKTLDFQRARQIADRELAVPYDKNNGLGFAIIRL